MGGRLVLDKYDATCGAESLHRRVAATIGGNSGGIERECGRVTSIVLRLEPVIQAAAQQNSNCAMGGSAGVPPEGPVIFSENGVRLEAEVLRGQKRRLHSSSARETGIEVETLAAGQAGLICFSFSRRFLWFLPRAGVCDERDRSGFSAHAFESAKRILR